MVRAELGLPQLQDFLVEFERVGIALQKAVAVGQRVHRRPQFGVAGRELQLLEREGFLAKL